MKPFQILRTWVLLDSQNNPLMEGKIPKQFAARSSAGAYASKNYNNEGDVIYLPAPAKLTFRGIGQ